MQFKSMALFKTENKGREGNQIALSFSLSVAFSFYSCSNEIIKKYSRIQKGNQNKILRPDRTGYYCWLKNGSHDVTFMPQAGISFSISTHQLFPLPKKAQSLEKLKCRHKNELYS